MIDQLPINKELSRSAATIVDARPKECFRNSALATLYLGGDARYIEGVIVIPVAGGLPIEHGWAVRDGQIVEPTLADDPWLDDLVYFEAKRFTPNEISTQHSQGLPFTTFRDEEMRWAHTLALAYINSGED